MGSGAFGDVILAKHKNSGISYAIKIISKAKLARIYGSENQKHFQEQEILDEVTREQNENLLPLIETFEDDNVIMLVTKLMAGGDLSNLISRLDAFPMTEEQARVIILDVVSGLQSLHKRNIVHRDIKSINILMSDKTADATACIADLGSAIKLKSATDTTDLKIGTPGYIAPEVLLGKPYSFSCDIWSLGCVLYFLLTGSQPFWDSDSAIRHQRVCSEELNLEDDPSTAHLSRSCKDILACMLDKDENRRFNINQVLHHTWLH